MRTMKRLLLLVFVLASVAWSDDRKLSPELKGQHSAAVIDVIVQFRVPPAQKHRDRVATHGGMVSSTCAPSRDC